METKKTFFENKIKPTLLYIGTIGASLMVIAYIAVVFVLVFGFKVTSIKQSFIFAAVNGIVGFIIMQLLKMQGIDFAKSLEVNQEVLKEWGTLKAKKKKAHSITYFWTTSIIKDAFIKALTIIVTTALIIYIVIEGSNDYSMLLLAFVNLVMFICFGLMSLVKAYDFFNEEHIPFIKEQINENKRKSEERLEMAKKELDKQRDADLHVNRRSNLLDTCVGNSTPCVDNRSMVVDSNNCSDSVLGRTIHTCSTATNSTNLCAQENTSKDSEEKEEC